MRRGGKRAKLSAATSAATAATVSEIHHMEEYEEEEECVSDTENHIRDDTHWEYFYREVDAHGDDDDRNMAGLLFENFREKAFDNTLNIGSGIHDPLKDLVYRVHPLPESMVDHVFDFGSLSASTEALYIRGMLRRMLGIYVSEEEQETERAKVVADEAQRQKDQTRGLGGGGMINLPAEGFDLPVGTRLIFNPTTEYEYGEGMFRRIFYLLTNSNFKIKIFE
jgi:hypothetical protein